MKVRFLDLSIKDKNEKKELFDALEKHLNSGQFIEGEELKDFEQNFAKSVDKKFAVGLNSGTDALIIGIKSLELNSKKNKILTTHFSWLSSSTSILMAGCEPIFCRLNEELMIDIELLPNPPPQDVGALLLVHLNGYSANVKKAKIYCEKYGIYLIEDCAQSYGVIDKNNNKSGALGDISCFSFNAMKVLSGLGDGGAVCTNDEKLFEKFLKLRHSGFAKDGADVSLLSHNCRMDSLHASFLNIRLKNFKEKQEKIKRLSQYYKDKMNGLVQFNNYKYTSITNNYTIPIIVNDRSKLISYLSKNNIETKIRHEFSIFDHSIFSKYKIDDPIYDNLKDKHLCLPIHANMDVQQIDYIYEIIRDYGKFQDII